jgi:hypothetical protein
LNHDKTIGPIDLLFGVNADIKGCTFKGNSGYFGAIRVVDGGNSDYEVATATFTNNKFESNRSTNEWGARFND